jgi:type III pantothenate kinase
MTGPSLVAVNVGNTRTHVGLFRQGALERSSRLSNDQPDAIVEAVRLAWSELDDSEAPVAIASVNDEFAMPLRSRIELDEAQVIVIGDDVAVPIGESLDPETLTGVDRLLNAAAAWDRLKQACIVVDAGTAVTVDFVDGAGVFQGGAIAPGARLQLSAMHEHTSALPAISFARPDEDAFGRNTRQAMLNGVFYGLRGLVWKLVERYAEAYGAFPLVIATGGDANALFEGDELVNHVVPDLTLLGIEVAVRWAMQDDADEASAAEPPAP